MRVCPICRLAYRANDPGGSCFVPEENRHGAKSGHYAACSECCQVYEGGGYFTGVVAMVATALPDDQIPASYPAGLTNGLLDSCPAWFCAVCRRWAREDDQMEGLRLAAEDLVDRPGMKPGVYYSCSECRRQYAPNVLARLKRDGVVPAEFPVELMTPQLLS